VKYGGSCLLEYSAQLLLVPSASAGGGSLELGHDVGACQRAEVARADDRRLALSELPDRLARFRADLVAKTLGDGRALG
jgi:hypothetical protein